MTSADALRAEGEVARQRPPAPGPVRRLTQRPARQRSGGRSEAGTMKDLNQVFAAPKT